MKPRKIELELVNIVVWFYFLISLSSPSETKGNALFNKETTFALSKRISSSLDRNYLVKQFQSWLE